MLVNPKNNILFFILVIILIFIYMNKNINIKNINIKNAKNEYIEKEIDNMKYLNFITPSKPIHTKLSNYNIITFKSNGFFTITKEIDISYILIGGGGAGGSGTYGAGGGSGGNIVIGTMLVEPGIYAVNVGEGGINSNFEVAGGNGMPSALSGPCESVIALGGIGGNPADDKKHSIGGKSIEPDYPNEYMGGDGGSCNDPTSMPSGSFSTTVTTPIGSFKTAGGGCSVKIDGDGCSVKIDDNSNKAGGGGTKSSYGENNFLNSNSGGNGEPNSGGGGGGGKAMSAAAIKKKSFSEYLGGKGGSGIVILYFK